MLLTCRRKALSLAVIFALFFTACPVVAQRFPRTEWSLRNDNDLYLLNKQDQYYTNGLVLTIQKPVDSTRLLPRELNRLWGLSVGQKMYTAYTGQVQAIEEVDRPITAYLFIGFNSRHFYANESILGLNIELGAIGRHALGRQAQETVHKTFKLYEVSGWEYQLKDAIGIDIGVDYATLLYRNPRRWFEITAQAAGKLGLNHTNVSVSPTFRWGKMNPSHTTAYFSGRLQSRAQPIDNELFFYFKPQLNWVAYDATIQGGLFLQDKGPVIFKPARWVLSQHIGVIFARRSFTLNMQYVFNTKESPDMFFRHRYGSLGLSYRY